MKLQQDAGGEGTSIDRRGITTVVHLLTVLFCTFLKKTMKKYKKLCPEDIASFTFF
jgi:hypothetical protein